MRFSLFAIFFSVAMLIQLPSHRVLTGMADAAGTRDAAGYGAGARQNSYSSRQAVPGMNEKERQLAEKEAALNLKEQELKRLSARLDAQMREIEAARKSMETTLSTKKKADGDRYKKMLKLYKALRPEEAAGLIDKLDEDLAMELLNQMDTRTAAKLIPFLDKKRVLKWSRTSLKGN